MKNKNIEKTIKNTLKKIKIPKKSKIIVALSGGKDSTLVAYMLHKLGYTIEGFHIDLKIGKYSEDCLVKVQELCKLLDCKLHIYDIKKEMGSSMCYLRSGIQQRAKGQIKNCAICGVIKKWVINKQVRKLKADYIATGHNLDDEAQTFLMNIMKGSPQLSANLGIITKNISDNKFIPRIKPLFYIPEDEIRKYTKKLGLPVHYQGCPCAIDSYRIHVRKFLETLPNKDKINIVNNFEALQEKIKKPENSIINYCEACGEPARKKLCKKCSLMEI